MDRNNVEFHKKSPFQATAYGLMSDIQLLIAAAAAALALHSESDSASSDDDDDDDDSLEEDSLDSDDSSHEPRNEIANSTFHMPN
jgi:hypothetical protein